MDIVELVFFYDSDFYLIFQQRNAFFFFSQNVSPQLFESLMIVSIKNHDCLELFTIVSSRRQKKPE